MSIVVDLGLRGCSGLLHWVAPEKVAGAFDSLFGVNRVENAVRDGLGAVRQDFHDGVSGVRKDFKEGLEVLDNRVQKVAGIVYKDVVAGASHSYSYTGASAVGLVSLVSHRILQNPILMDHPACQGFGQFVCNGNLGSTVCLAVAAGAGTIALGNSISAMSEKALDKISQATRAFLKGMIYVGTFAGGYLLFARTTDRTLPIEHQWSPIAVGVPLLIAPFILSYLTGSSQNKQPSTSSSEQIPAQSAAKTQVSSSGNATSDYIAKDSKINQSGFEQSNEMINHRLQGKIHMIRSIQDSTY